MRSPAPAPLRRSRAPGDGSPAARGDLALTAATGPPSPALAWVGGSIAAAAFALFVVVAAVVTRSDGRDRWDLAVRDDLAQHAGGVPTALAGVAVDLAAPAVLAVVALVAVVVLWRWAHRPLLGAGVLAVAVSTAALVQLLALAFSDVRPSSLTLLGLPVFDGSFPSIRTADAAALWGALALAGLLLVRRAGARVACAVTGLLLSAVLAWGQLDRAHAWPTDVLGGWLLGAVAVGVAAALLATWPAPPAVPPRGTRPTGASRSTTTGVRGTTLGR